MKKILQLALKMFVGYFSCSIQFFFIDISLIKEFLFGALLLSVNSLFIKIASQVVASLMHTIFLNA